METGAPGPCARLAVLGCDYCAQGLESEIARITVDIVGLRSRGMGLRGALAAVMSGGAWPVAPE